ncbi:nucleoside monophosphate kinase [Patescibacteria group bacterium]|nr:nucleoside monophosphate kinase [Patescibacteria group bacterium]
MKHYDALIFMGIQGSGKGTQARLLADEFGYSILEAGKILREEAASGSSLGKKIDEIIHGKGELVPDEITKELVKNFLNDIQEGTPVIFDAYPRTLVQLHDLEEILKEHNIANYRVVYFTLTDDEAMKRLLSRRECESCKAPTSDSAEEACKKCGGTLVRRKDDEPEKIQKRLAWSHKETQPVVDAYEEKGVLIVVDGNESIDQVYEELKQKLA